jgi:hypothetical protein
LNTKNANVQGERHMNAIRNGALNAAITMHLLAHEARTDIDELSAIRILRAILLLRTTMRLFPTGIERWIGIGMEESRR